MRPRQWVKNVLVFAAPLAAGSLFSPEVLVTSLWAFVAFCLVSASIYLINDVRDVEADRQHPKKRLRPIAAGELSVRTALVLAGVTAVASLALGFWVAPLLGVTLATYWVLQVGYSLFLKNQPIIDLAMVASGFILRAVAGGVASGIELSQWFLLVAAFGSLFMVAGKRYSEIRRTRPRRRYPRLPGPLHRHLPAVRLDAGLHRRDHVLQPVGLRAARAIRCSAYRGLRSRSPRSPSPCCGTPTSSTPARPANPRTSCSPIASCRRSGRCGWSRSPSPSSA